MLSSAACDQPGEPSVQAEAGGRTAGSVSASAASSVASGAVWVDTNANKQVRPGESASASAAERQSDASASATTPAPAPASASAAPTASGTSPAPQDPVAAAKDVPSKLEALKRIAKQGVLPKGEADKVMRLGDEPKVVLLDKGKEPLAELKYELPVDAKESSTLTMEMTMGMNLGGGRQSQMAMPLVELVVAQTTAPKREADGAISVASLFTSVGVTPGAGADPRAVAEFSKGLDSLKGMKIVQLLTPKGRLREAKMELAPGASPQSAQFAEQMQRSMDQVMTPLPDEAVGENARWIVLIRLNSGADILQWTTYRLKSKKGKLLELEALVSQLIASPELKAQGPGATIQSFISGGSGTTLMDLGHLSPDKGTATVTSSMSVGNQSQSAAIDTQVKITFLRK